MASFAWLGGTNNDWHTAANWQFTSGVDNGVAGVPDAGDSAQFSTVAANLSPNLATPVTLDSLSFSDLPPDMTSPARPLR